MNGGPTRPTSGDAAAAASVATPGPAAAHPGPPAGPGAHAALTPAAAWGTILGVPVVALMLALGVQLATGGAALVPGLLAGQATTLANTTLYGLLTAVVVTAVAWAMAHTQHSYDFRGRRLVHVLALAPLLMPSFTVAIALVVLAGQNGWLTGATGVRLDIYGLPGLVVASVFARLPFAYLGLVLAYRLLDARRIDAARDLGASRLAVLRTVTWPGLRLPVAAVAVVAFADTVADLANPLVIGGGFPVVASRLYESVTAEGDLAAGSAFAVLLLAPAAVAMVATRRLDAARLSVPAAMFPGDARRPRGVGWALVAVSWTVAGAVAVLLTVVAVAALVPGTGGPTLESFAAVLDGPHTRALATTVLLSCLAVPLVIGCSVAVTLTSAARERWLRTARRTAGALSAVPNVVLGLAALLLVLTLPGAAGDDSVLRALVLGAVVLLVHVVRGVPAAVTPMLAAAGTLLPDTRDAATQLGARGVTLARAVYLPALGPAVRAAALTTGARTLTATSSVILLSDQQLPLLTHRMLVEADAGRLSSAAAMTVVLGALVALLGLALTAGWPDDRRR